jgi:V/A-type H+/Na+-transporting ATPase subunit D
LAKIKHTKTELKTQREALARFERYLPMLQLKKQQLQSEIQGIDQQIAENERREAALRSDLRRWVRLFAEPAGIETRLVVERISTAEGNIAGVPIPVLQDLEIRRAEVDLFSTPAWIDDGLDAVEALTRLRVEREILQAQRQRIVDELWITSQRVNLFEKVKIPECRENIRTIKIFLGDEQTAAVARAKLAKSRAA